MDDFNYKNQGVQALGEMEAKREWIVGILGASFCYALILWLC
ncbi:hypothetical protein [Limnobacter parvus]|uniref:Uncharacterized protein n=1 Tax=Limnobacter parvus TaxID=2939690 RepID=A0ABT1XHA4_9BURK|nr:hypothetical protein [Limnobacter parvus]MCR2746665.1 hypothetical protein [Limnobacter parvus]